LKAQPEVPVFSSAPMFRRSIAPCFRARLGKHGGITLPSPASYGCAAGLKMLRSMRYVRSQPTMVKRENGSGTPNSAAKRRRAALGALK
jgi:hypothetical protein